MLVAGAQLLGGPVLPATGGPPGPGEERGAGVHPCSAVFWGYITFDPFAVTTLSPVVILVPLQTLSGAGNTCQPLLPAALRLVVPRGSPEANCNDKDAGETWGCKMTDSETPFPPTLPSSIPL